MDLPINKKYLPKFLEAMEEHAEQKAIHFIDWLIEKKILKDDDLKYYLKDYLKEIESK